MLTARREGLDPLYSPVPEGSAQEPVTVSLSDTFGGSPTSPIAV